MKKAITVLKRGISIVGLLGALMLGACGGDFKAISNTSRVSDVALKSEVLKSVSSEEASQLTDEQIIERFIASIERIIAHLESATLPEALSAQKDQMLAHFKSLLDDAKNDEEFRKKIVELARKRLESGPQIPVSSPAAGPRPGSTPLPVPSVIKEEVCNRLEADKDNELLPQDLREKIAKRFETDCATN